MPGFRGDIWKIAPDDMTGKTGPGNRGQVMRRGPQTAIRCARRVMSPFCFGRGVGHPWSGGSTFGEVR